mgnify:CR=1 FL=1
MVGHKRKKSSGYFYGKQKEKRREEDEQMSGSLSNFFINTKSKPTTTMRDPCDVSVCDEIHEIQDATTSSNLEVENELKGEKSKLGDEANLSTTSQIALPEEEQSFQTLPTTDLTDPANWPDRIPDDLRVTLVKNGPSAPNPSFLFPVNANNRRFNPSCTQKVLKNGEVVKRSWLIYSKRKDVVFCFSCKLFGDMDIHLKTIGFGDWKNLHRQLKEHETSKNHICSLSKWMELANRLDTNKTIDASQQRLLSAEIQRWQLVLERLFAIVIFLGEQCLAFRGNSDVLHEKSNGNFLKLVELLAQFDAVMADHVHRIKNKEIDTHYLGKNIQNELIQIIAKRIREEILSKLKMAKYFSIIVDCTHDVSKVEQMSIVLRFVQMENAEVKVCEHFIDFIPVEQTTGAALTDVILQMLTQTGIPIEDMRGQGYDNGANMRGHQSGVQKRILEKNSRAFFVPCHAHSLNLVVNDAAKSSREAVAYFGMVQAIYNFLSGSSRRWTVLKNHLGKKIFPKPLSATRWESRIEAVRPFRYCAGEIFDVLFEISQDISYDPSSRHEAEVLAQKMKNFKFCCCTVIWFNILNQVKLASKVIQNIEIDISEAKQILNKTVNFLKLYRSDEAFEKVISDAELIAAELDLEPSFAFEVSIRPRFKKQMCSSETRDDPIINPKDRFKIECFNCILDSAINSIEERFNQLNEHCDAFEFLYDIANIKKDFSKESLREKCLNLQKILSTDTSADIDGVELLDELLALSELIEPKTSPIKVLQFILRNNNFTPNVSIALRILLTQPVSVASGERSFSKLKLIKDYLRSTMSQNRLTGLSLISIESDIAKKLDFTELLKAFASEKCRKVNFFH